MAGLDIFNEDCGQRMVDAAVVGPGVVVVLSHVVG